MPPRYAYWTIIAGGLPTAFRAAEREELLPTFQRIREKHPDAQMKWFARGKLWESPEAARVRHDEGRGRRPFGDRPAGDPRDRRGGSSLSDQARRAKSEGPPAGEKRDGNRSDEAGRDRERRSRDWRPGGEHRDPRQKFVDAKKQKNAALRKDRWDRKNAPPRERPRVDPPRDDVARQPRPAAPGNWRDRPRENRGVTPQRPWQDRDRGRDPRGPQPKRDWRDRPPADRPWQDRRPRDVSRRGDVKPDLPRRSEAKADPRAPQGKSGWRPKPGGWDREPAPRGRDTREPQEPRPRGPDREPRRQEATDPTPPPKPDLSRRSEAKADLSRRSEAKADLSPRREAKAEPKAPAPGPSERGHIKHRRPFQPRGGFSKGP